MLWYFAVLALLPHGTEKEFMVFGPLTGRPAADRCFLLSQPRRAQPEPPALGGRGVVLSVVVIGSLWVAGTQSPWSPNFDPVPLTAQIVGATSGPVFEGARLFQEKACLNCHLIDGYGGRRGPDLPTSPTG